MNIGLGALRFFNRVLRDGRNGGFQAGIQSLRSRCLPLRNQSGDKGVRFKFGWIAGVADHKWFQGYNPMSNDSSDTPYDYDHILPYSHLIAQGGNPKVDSDNDAMVKKFSDCRWRYINSIGNFRVWPSWANRSDQNDCHTKKLRLTKIEPDSLGQELDLKSADDFMRASAINIEDKALWIKAGGSPRNWNEERRLNNHQLKLVGFFATD